MGLFLGLITRRYLKIKKSNYVWQMHLITKAKSAAAAAANNLMQIGSAGNDYAAGSALEKKLQQRQYKMKILEDKLDLQKAEIQTKLDEINTELQSVEGMINSSIKTSFSYNVQ